MSGMRWGRSWRILRKGLRGFARGVIFWSLVLAFLLYLPFWALAEWLHGKRHNRRRASVRKPFNEALSAGHLMGDGDTLPEPDGEVAILPEYSPSIHRADVFNPEVDAVQIVTLKEAMEAGFTPCVRCWDDVDPEEPKPIEELDLDEEDMDP